ncbi:hypothetical protein AbraIFM66951_007956 [Aspergillus brasiliensis]|uniref:Uncharacterized protein n=1 Tax=Aspergillus brasiliensis TaxID=319629 RepID=A0A9W6DMS2_9EURO|nr:hypothetical protein AbraCBS73388_008462 [Aspergillus brasiliensis]GKZ45339.1 hypothetical protein AbraIFM66951_007956 [Aspergillus brasiliensis]
MVTTRMAKALKRTRSDAESSDSDDGTASISSNSTASNSGNATANKPGSTDIYGNDYFFCDRDEFHDVLQQLNDMQHQPAFRRGYPGLMKEEFHRLHGSLMSWTWRYRRDENLAPLSKEEKQDIIASLEGQCVQDDWDSIKALSPPAIRESMCDVLLQAMLYQFIFATFIEFPFWFLDGRIDPTDTEGDPQFLRRFQYLYERLRAASGFGAACLKSSIITEANARPVVTGIPYETEIAQNTFDHRKTLISTFTDELLKRRVFQLLLRPLDDDAEVARRHYGLHFVLEKAVEAIIYTEGGIYGNSVIVRLPELPVFDYEDNRMTSHYYHFVGYRRKPGFAPAPGGRSLIVARPGLTYVDMRKFGRVQRIPPCQMFPAEVVAEVLPEETNPKSKAKPRKTTSTKKRKSSKKKKMKKAKTESHPDSKSAVPETSSASQAANAPDAENDSKVGQEEKEKPPTREFSKPRLTESFWRV